jgi:hypothetical protein
LAADQIRRDAALVEEEGRPHTVQRQPGSTHVMALGEFVDDSSVSASFTTHVRTCTE